jgi:carboxyl-terminal processing protease
VGEYFTPRGRNLGGGGIKRGAGIVPDVHAADTGSTAHDEALDTAFDVLAQKLIGPQPTPATPAGAGAGAGVGKR